MLLLAGRLTIFCRNIVSSSPISLHYRYAYSSSNSLENDLGESASASSQLSGLKATNSYEGPLHTPILISSISSTASVFLSSQPRAPRQAWIETLKLYNGDKENSKAKPLDHNLPLGLVDLSPEVFATFPRLDLVHKNLYWQAHYRIVDWRCITRRSEMTYRSQRKPWPQKGTGRARHGNRRTHLWHGGSQCKGPRGPTAFFSVLPRHVRLAGLISMLTVKHAQDDLHVVDDLRLSSELEEEAYTLFAHANASRKAAFAKSGLNHLDNKDMLETLKIAEQQARFIEVSNASALYLRELISARNWGSSVLFITDSALDPDLIFPEEEEHPSVPAESSPLKNTHSPGTGDRNSPLAIHMACNSYARYVAAESTPEAGLAAAATQSHSPAPRAGHPGRGLTLMPVCGLNVWSLVLHSGLVISLSALQRLESALHTALASSESAISARFGLGQPSAYLFHEESAARRRSTSQADWALAFDPSVFADARDELELGDFESESHFEDGEQEDKYNRWTKMPSSRPQMVRRRLPGFLDDPNELARRFE